VFKYTATYKDLFTGDETHEDLYFHLIAPELTGFELSYGEGGFSEFLAKTLAKNDNFEIYSMFVKLVSISYGRRSDDGKRFIKNQEWTQEFLTSPAWEDFFFWLVAEEDGKNANKFWVQIMPERLVKEADKQLGKKVEDLSPEEMREMLKRMSASVSAEISAT
jgi:hypothetical protein